MGVDHLCIAFLGFEIEGIGTIVVVIRHLDLERRTRPRWLRCILERTRAGPEFGCGQWGQDQQMAENFPDH